ncbi:hypothetical protein MBLNU457_2382t2 [Dothideomycetes sp. NU457]
MSLTRVPRLLSRRASALLYGPITLNIGNGHAPALQRRHQHDAPKQDTVPVRKQLKDEAKARKKAAKATKAADTTTTSSQTSSRLSKWELTVGIEIHAELNTAHKLFSSAQTSTNAALNTHVAPFDAALPGTQPTFQPATLIPAIRAALALKCTIQPRSAFDRKHYFYQDQPNGYQITQYYSPFARDGELVLTATDGIDPGDADADGKVVVRIKQVQMEQDTAKSTHQAPSTYLMDFNRVSHPLVEIISLPDIHSPATAAAYVRKVQGLLRAVDACVAGMETGGLRADVNVSVRRRGEEGSGEEYAGVRGLGTRTEIKNLSSFKAVEDSIVAERDRQIAVLEAGGVIEGETRGWTIGSTETTRLRSKEGEVDYRYMPDPDLGSIYVGQELVNHLASTLPEMPEDTIARAMNDFALSRKDATTLFSQDDGERLEFCAKTADIILSSVPSQDKAKVGKMVGNWILHEIGGLLTEDNRAWSDVVVTPQILADILSNLLQRNLTGRNAKQLLQQVYRGDATTKSVDQLIDEGNLRLRPMGEDEYQQLAQSILDENPDMVRAIREKGQKGKAMFFVGQMVRRAEEGTVEADKARQVVETLLGI